MSMQKLAHAAGLCFLDPKFHLAIHPTLGPWVSFRFATTTLSPYLVPLLTRPCRPSAAISVEVDASDIPEPLLDDPIPEESRPLILAKFDEAIRETRARNRTSCSFVR